MTSCEFKAAGICAGDPPVRIRKGDARSLKGIDSTVDLQDMGFWPILKIDHDFPVVALSTQRVSQRSGKESH